MIYSPFIKSDKSFVEYRYIFMRLAAISTTYTNTQTLKRIKKVLNMTPEIQQDHIDMN